MYQGRKKDTIERKQERKENAMALSFEERANRAWEELSIQDNFIFLRVMQNKGITDKMKSVRLA